MKKKYKLVIGALMILLIISLFFLKRKKAVNYKFIGKYKYEIINDSLFENTYLHGSFGYVIGNLSIPGVEIVKIENLNKQADYIISLNHPIKTVNEKLIDCNDKTKIPVEVVQDINTKSNDLYIYKLDVKGKYKLQTP